MDCVFQLEAVTAAAFSTGLLVKVYVLNLQVTRKEGDLVQFSLHSLAMWNL